MLDLGWTELLVIGIVALIVIGPKDLPGMFRTLGRFTAKARNMARDFQRAMDDAADQAGVKDVASGLKDAANPRKMGLDALNDAADKFEKWEPGTKSGTSTDKTEDDSSAAAKGPETSRLTEERAAQAQKIRETSARYAEARHAAEAEAEAEAKARAAAEGAGTDDTATPDSAGKGQG